MSAAFSAAPWMGAARAGPICGRHAGLRRHNAAHGYGLLSSGGCFAHCTREEHAAGVDLDNAGTYPHRRDSPCPCGSPRGGGLPAPLPGNRRAPDPVEPPTMGRPLSPTELCPAGVWDASVCTWTEATDRVQGAATQAGAPPPCSPTRPCRDVVRRGEGAYNERGVP